jgi:hypothetical protein
VISTINFGGDPGWTEGTLGCAALGGEAAQARETKAKAASDQRWEDFIEWEDRGSRLPNSKTAERRDRRTPRLPKTETAENRDCRKPSER